MEEVGSYDEDKVMEWLMSLSPKITIQSAKEFIERYLDWYRMGDNYNIYQIVDRSQEWANKRAALARKKALSWERLKQQANKKGEHGVHLIK